MTWQGHELLISWSKEGHHSRIIRVPEYNPPGCNFQLWSKAGVSQMTPKSFWTQSPHPGLNKEELRANSKLTKEIKWPKAESRDLIFMDEKRALRPVCPLSHQQMLECSSKWVERHECQHINICVTRLINHSIILMNCNSHKTLRNPLQIEAAKTGKSDAVSLKEMEVDNARIKI